MGNTAFKPPATAAKAPDAEGSAPSRNEQGDTATGDDPKGRGNAPVDQVKEIGKKLFLASQEISPDERLVALRNDGTAPERLNLSDGTITLPYKNGDVRTIKLRDGSNQAESATFFNKREGRTYEYTRIHDFSSGGKDPKGENKDSNDVLNSFHYAVKDASGKLVGQGTWNGDIVLRDGAFAFKEGKNTANAKPDGFWRTLDTNGATLRERDNPGGSHQSFDDSWNLVRMKRADGSSIECTRSNGTLSQIDNIDSKGERTTWNFDQKRQQWISSSKDIAPSTTPPVNQQGELEYRNTDGTRNHVWLDGTVERTNVDGTVARLNKDGIVTMVTQPNGDYRQIQHAGEQPTGFTDYAKDGTVKGSGKNLVNASIDKHGYLQYDGDEQTRVVEKPFGAKEVLLADGRKQSVSYPNGDRRDVTYIGETEKFQDFSFYSAKDNQTTKYVRNGDLEEWSYTVKNGDGKVTQEGTWKGSLELRHGMMASRGEGTKPEGFWLERGIDGREYHERENKDGSQQVFDKDWQLVNLYRPNGSRLDCTRVNGELTEITNTSHDGQTSRWSFDRQRKEWISDSPEIAPSAASPIDQQGTLRFTNTDGTLNRVDLNGSTVRTNTDGSSALIDPQGFVKQLTWKNGDYRAFIEKDGQTIGYTDYTKDGTKKETVDNLPGFYVDTHGNIGHRLEDGSKVLERTNGVRLKFKADHPDRVDLVECPDGSSRKLYYVGDTQQVRQAVDTVYDGKQWQQQLWQRKENLPTELGGTGSPVNKLERIDIASGRVLEHRDGVRFDQFGDYTFAGRGGKQLASQGAGNFKVPELENKASKEKEKAPESTKEPEKRRPERRAPTCNSKSCKLSRGETPDTDEASIVSAAGVDPLEALNRKLIANAKAAGDREQVLKQRSKSDPDGSITTIYPDGDVRKVALIPDSNTVESLVHTRKADNRTYSYTRITGESPKDESGSGAQAKDSQSNDSQANDAGGKQSNQDQNGQNGNSTEQRYKIKVTDANGKVLQEGVWNGSMEWRKGTLACLDGAASGAESGSRSEPPGFWRTVHADGTHALERENASGSTQVFDRSGQYNLLKATRKDGSQVLCTRENGVLTKVVDTDGDGKGKSITWINDREHHQWVSYTPGIAPSKNPPVNQQGELDYKETDGTKVRKYLDGTVIRTNTDGSSATVESGGVTAIVTQANGDYRKILYTEGKPTGFTDFARDGKEKQSVDHLQNATIDKHGYMSYAASDGTRVVEGANNAFTRTNGDTEVRRYPSGDMHTIVFEGDSSAGDGATASSGIRKVHSVSRHDAKTHTTMSYMRSEVDGQWNCELTDASGNTTPKGIWKGAIECRDGLYAVKGDNIKAPAGFWLESNVNGQTFYERENKDHSRQRFDSGWQLTNLYRPNGSSLECTRENGQLLGVTNTDAKGGQTHWAYDPAKRKWCADAADIAPSVTAPMDAQGLLSFMNTDHTRNKVFLDGSMYRTVAGGVRVEIDGNGTVNRAVGRKGDYRQMLYEKDIPVGYADFSKEGKELNRVTGLENLKINKLADLDYTSNGARVVERADKSRVHYDADSPDQPTRVTRPDGSYRQFYRDKSTKELLAIEDVDKRDNGERHALWVRRENIQPPFGPGGLSDTFERVDPKTEKVLEARHGLKTDEFGDYTYSDVRGRERVSKVAYKFHGPGDEFDSANIDDAHAFLVDAVYDHFGSEKRAAAFEQMMMGFEHRMAGTIRRRVAIGEDEDKVREEVEQEIVKSYANLSRMFDPDAANAFDDRPKRGQLGENLMYLLWEPQTAKQGGRNSCWFMSQWNEDVARYPGTFSQLFADVSLTGKCKDRSGAQYTFSQADLAQTQTREGVGWSIADSVNNSHPSPAVDRMERILLKVGGESAYRWHHGGGSDRARNILAQVVPHPIGYMGGQFPTTKDERLALMRDGAMAKSGGAHHVNNMFVRSIRLDQNGHMLLHDTSRNPGEEKDSDIPVVFGLFRGDQYEGGDKLVAVIKDPQKFVETGEMAPVDYNYPSPQLGKQYQIADAYKASDFKPGRHGRSDRNDNDRRPWVPFWRRG